MFGKRRSKSKGRPRFLEEVEKAQLKIMKIYLNVDEIVRIEESATNLRDRLLVRLLFHTGCRISEALALTVNNIDFGQGAITIQHLKSRLKISCPVCHTRLGRNHVFCPKCGHETDKTISEMKEHRRRRIIPIDKETLSLLRDYIS